jgi:hypothetical protein
MKRSAERRIEMAAQKELEMEEEKRLASLLTPAGVAAKRKELRRQVMIERGMKPSQIDD